MSSGQEPEISASKEGPTEFPTDQLILLLRHVPVLRTLGGLIKNEGAQKEEDES